MSAGEAVLRSTQYLKEKGVDSPRLDAELLLCRVLDCPRLRLYMEWQKPLTELEIAAYRDFIRRRGQEREPVARIVGLRDFYGRDFEVTPESFVPRPETEMLVEMALATLQTEPPLKDARGTIFDIGTGTGCIVVTMAAESDGHQFYASDVSAGAIATARRNAHRHKVDSRIDFRHGAYFADFRGSLSMIVSNPPYVERDVIPTLEPEVWKFDPREALDGGEDGLDPARIIARDGADLLIHGGWTLLELGEGQPPRAAEMFKATGHYTDIRTVKDYAGIERFLIARRS